MPLDPANFGVVGGDDEPPFLLRSLSERNPEHEFIVVGRNSGEVPQDIGFGSNVSNPWTELRPIIGQEVKKKSAAETVAILDRYTLDLFRDLDGLVVWTGQHGTSNSPIPPVGKGWHEQVTQPQISFVNYASYVVRGINAFRQADPLNREEIWLAPDPRNYLKCRDLKWPPRHQVLGQFDFGKMEKHERYGDTRDPAECGFVAEWEGDHVWKAAHSYMYSRLEICGILPSFVDSHYLDNWEDREHFGLFINEARDYVKWNRLDAMRDWVLPLQPAFMHGKWLPASLETLGVDIQPAPSAVYYDKLRSVKCSFTTPSSGSGWATTKPWQSFATGTVCFFHPQYDTQGHIIPTMEQVRRHQVADEELAHIASWLRVEDPDQLAKRVKIINESENTWRWLSWKLRQMYERACNEMLHCQHIESRLGV